MNIGQWCKKIFNPRPQVDYVSEVDQLLAEFDKTHTNSKAQQKEIDKHVRIFTLRDKPTQPDLKSKIWMGF